MNIMHDDSICKYCKFVSNCQYFFNVLKHDDIENKKQEDYKTFTVIYSCKKFDK